MRQAIRSVENLGIKDRRGECAERKTVRHVIRPVVRVTPDVSRFQAEQGISQPTVVPTDRTLSLVRTENVLAETGIARRPLPPARASRIWQTNGIPNGRVAGLGPETAKKGYERKLRIFEKRFPKLLETMKRVVLAGA